AVLADQTEANLQADRLPDSLLRRIDRSPIVIFSSELAYAQANHLNLFPLYGLQPYCTYTHWLDRATAERLLTRTPPATRLVMEWGAIDERHPLLDVPATWNSIYTGFHPELVDSTLLLLKKRDSPRILQFKPLGRAKADLRQWQNVPDRDHAVSASVSLSLTTAGVARRLFYKTTPVFIEFETNLSILAHFRIVPDVLREPFIINCLPLDAASLEFLLFHNTCQQKVTRFRFLGEGLESFSLFSEISFAEAPDERLQFRFQSAAPSLGPQSIAIPPDAPFWNGSVDTVPLDNSITNPL